MLGAWCLALPNCHLASVQSVKHNTPPDQLHSAFTSQLLYSPLCDTILPTKYCWCWCWWQQSWMTRWHEDGGSAPSHLHHSHHPSSNPRQSRAPKIYVNWNRYKLNNHRSQGQSKSIKPWFPVDGGYIVSECLPVDGIWYIISEFLDSQHFPSLFWDPSSQPTGQPTPCQ